MKAENARHEKGATLTSRQLQDGDYVAEIFGDPIPRWMQTSTLDNAVPYDPLKRTLALRMRQDRRHVDDVPGAYRHRVHALTAVALHAAAPVIGERMIDVGCGCGATVLELARRVGPTSHVLGLDVLEPMSARARERIAPEELGNAKVVVHDAASYVFPLGIADLLFSRFGVVVLLTRRQRLPTCGWGHGPAAAFLAWRRER
jgi:SAM-dependent methyltransferase